MDFLIDQHLEFYPECYTMYIGYACRCNSVKGARKERKGNM